MIKFTPTDSGRINSGYTDENNDCTVRALSEVTGSSYKQAHIFWAELGRARGKGSYMKWLYEYMDSNNDKVFGMKVIKHDIPFSDRERKVDGEIVIKRLNVKTFIQNNPTGKFMVITRNHAKAIVDSEIRDLDQGIYSEIKWVYEFKSPTS